MTRRVVMVLWLTLTWVFLWEDASPGVLLGGALLSTFLVMVLPPNQSEWLVVRPVPALRYLAYFLYNLVTSSLSTARVVLNPRSDPKGGIIEVELGFSTPILVMVVAHSISLTPGTLSIDARSYGDHTKLYVHILEATNIEAERESISRLEQLVIGAFAPRHVRESFVPISESGRNGR